MTLRLQARPAFAADRSPLDCVMTGPKVTSWLVLSSAGGQDVVRMAVEVLAGAVVSHGGARVGVACCDLDVAQVDSRVKHRGHERVPEHLRVGAAYPRAAQEKMATLALRAKTGR
jgi:hypothetical protein